MIKRLLIALLCLTLVLVLAVVILSRATGTGIRTHDGRFLGYSADTAEWLLLDYQNVPVREDGPYVFGQGEGRYGLRVTGDGQSPSSLSREEVEGSVQVVVDREPRTEFTVPLRLEHPRSTLEISGVTRYLAISDLEGNFDALEELLLRNSVVDSSLAWTFGDGHLILIGDIVDRGVNVVPCLWLIYKLEAEAALAGGGVHYVLGNHERYLLDGRVKSAAKKYSGTSRLTGLPQDELWSEDSELGRWLRSKPVLVKVNRTLFVNGGISPLVLGMGPTLQSVDDAAAASLTLGNSVFRSVSGDLLHDSTGILLHRGLAMASTGEDPKPKESAEHVAAVLKHFDVDEIAIGHTLSPKVGYDYGGSVLRVDVDHAAGVREGLLFDSGQLWRVDASGARSALGAIDDV